MIDLMSKKGAHSFWPVLRINAGRMPAVTALGAVICAAKLSAYTAARRIRWEGAWWRKHISSNALAAC
jgi:phosphoribosylamine-glycine ligase